MKTKLLSLLLVITLLAVTISTGLPSTIFAAEENLIKNGDFSDGYNGWAASGSNNSASIQNNVKINDTLTTNAVKVNTKANKMFALYTKNKIKIEKNTSYTMSFWVKMTNIKGFTAYFFEPDYTAKDGTYKTDEWSANDGVNVYTYAYDNGTTRVCRTDITHSWTVAGTGVELGDANGVSMFITRTNGKDNQVLTPDYPNAEKEGEWLQVIHTFKTGNSAAHEAVGAYYFKIPSNPVEGEIWFADFKMTAVKDAVDDYYTPAVNDESLGAVSENVPLIKGKTAEITAEPFGENKFDGWFVDGELVSEETTLTFTYDAANPPKYEARFTKAEWGIENGSFEKGYTNGQHLAKSASQNYDTDKPWTESLFKESSLDGENKFFLDSEWVPYGDVYASTEFAHTGKFSIKNNTDSRAVGYKITDLTENTEYSLSFYVMTTGTTQDGSTLDSLTVTDSNVSCMVKNPQGKIVQRTVEAGALAKKILGEVNCRNTWQKLEITFNSKNSKEVIVWLRSSKANTKTYLDTFSIKRIPASFKPQSNDANLGFASPAEGIPCVPGDEVTFTATPLEGNYFEGWYVGDELISTNPFYTFNYKPELQGLTAHFKAGETPVPNASFEDGYTNNQVLAQATHVQPIKPINDANWTKDSWKNTTKDDIHYIESNNGGTWRLAKVSTNFAHTGQYSLMLDAEYGYMGKKFTGLKKNTQYAISFYGMTKDHNEATFGRFKITKGSDPLALYNADGSDRAVSSYLAGSDRTYNYNEWNKVTLEFNSGDNTEVILWIYHNKGGTVYLDDFAIFEPVSGSVSADLGGSVTSNINSNILGKGTAIKLLATPLEGNTFAGWYDAAGNLVWENPEYSFSVTDSFKLVAKFDGYNKPATDMFQLNGFDGTFENGNIGVWNFTDSTYTCEWCSADVSTNYAYEGGKSLAINGRYRNSLLPITGLTPNSDYRLSFYLYQPDPDAKAILSTLGIIGENDTAMSTAGTMFAEVKSIPANMGWNRIDMFFNTGANTAVTLAFRYNAETTANGLDRLHIDNVSLHRYEAEKEVVNPGFDQDKFNWIGDGTVATEGENKVLKLGANESIYQDIAVDPFATYEISFKSKGDLKVAAQDLAKFNYNIKNFISSVSFVDAAGDEWNEYTFEVYTRAQEAINVVFKAGENGAMFDDLKVTKKKEVAGSIIEKIDFESLERFGLTSATDTNVFDIYEAQDENDPNVYSGKNSLRFKYNEALAQVASVFNESWLSYQTLNGGSVKLSMKFRIPDGASGGTINLAPEYSGTYGADTGFDHISRTSDWQTVSFYFVNNSYGVLKAKIASVLAGTKSDFYIDDIVISVTPPMVLEENSKITYCERLYNAVDNEGFEFAASDKDWANLPASAKIVKGAAQKGSYFLRANSGTKYVLPLKVEPGKEYYFGASVRGTAKTVGNIGVTTDPEGTTYFVNREDKPASMVAFDSKETNWKRSAFKFTTDSEYVYLTIDVTAGALDVDSVMMFTSDFGYRYDPNDYTVYVPYDYDNLKSATTVVNGGFGEQPYYDENADGTPDVGNTDSPSTGDSIAIPAITIILAVLASVTLLFVRKRKEGAENA